LEHNRPSEREIRSLYERHAKALVAYACSFGLDFASAQDTVQQLFLKLLSGVAIPEHLRPGYFYRAVRNTSLNALRDRSKADPLEENTSWLVHREGKRELEVTLQAALRQLPEEQREVVVMHIWGGMTLLEIAETTAASPNTVAARYRYALEKLRAAFDIQKPGEEGKFS
jgi:RNA polymerase sigma-70 factor, ECF subfamily